MGTIMGTGMGIGMDIGADIGMLIGIAMGEAAFMGLSCSYHSAVQEDGPAADLIWR